MELYQLRVIEEHKELLNKVKLLYNFLHSTHFNDLTKENKQLLEMQYHAMEIYASILEQRIKLF